MVRVVWRLCWLFFFLGRLVLCLKWKRMMCLLSVVLSVGFILSEMKVVFRWCVRIVSMFFVGIVWSFWMMIFFWYIMIRDFVGISWVIFGYLWFGIGYRLWVFLLDLGFCFWWFCFFCFWLFFLYFVVSVSVVKVMMICYLFRGSMMLE